MTNTLVHLSGDHKALEEKHTQLTNEYNTSESTLAEKNVNIN